MVKKRASKKRTRAEFEDCEEALAEIKPTIFEEFDQEPDIAEYYSGTGHAKQIKLEDIAELEGKPLYVCLDAKEMVNMLDLKKEVILTMLNQLEQVEGRFFRVESILPAFVQLRFHKRTLEDLAETERFFKVFSSVVDKK